ncbi:hypothetical protein MMC29_004192 [Sticta canariensis]|nr:hypothetical protein [Sticta canariensis]
MKQIISGRRESCKELGVASLTSVSIIAEKDKGNASTTQEVREEDHQPAAEATANKTRKSRRETGKGAKERKWQKLQTRLAVLNGTVEQNHQIETGQDEDIEMEHGGPGMIENGAEEVAQVDREDIVETYDARDGEEPPGEGGLDNTNEDQSSVIEDDEEELSMVPGVDEEGGNEKMANGDRIAHAADEVPITNVDEKILTVNNGIPMFKVPEVVN